MANKQIKGIKVGKTAKDAVAYDLNSIVGRVVSPDGTYYIINVDDEGNLYGVAADDSSASSASLYTISSDKRGALYINSLYCGGLDANEHTANYCSHNFVELANVSNVDIDLNGISLQYSDISGTGWKVLPLSGVIKAGSTFLVRGAQCSALSSPTTKIKVTEYDMEWTVDGTPITFGTTQGKFYLGYTTDALTIANPFTSWTATMGYVDLIGLVSSTGSIDAYEKAARTNLSNKYIFKRYYSMDPGDKALKVFTSRNNSTEWDYIDLTKADGDVRPSNEAYTPQASRADKNLYYDKTALSDDKPSIITCSFGIQATDSNSGATRCFDWVSKDLDSCYLWVKKSTDTSWGDAHRTFEEGDGRTEYTLAPYNRIIKEYTNDTFIVANKYIMNGLTAGTYSYVAGKKNEDGTPDLAHCTEEHTFTVRKTSDVKNFKFVQTSDQQGFNLDEYRVWEAAANTIVKESGDTIEFMINTGDMTQDGNRMNEWIDYFNGKGKLSNMEEMATIGNNDLSHRVLYEYSAGKDADKVWPENITFFYTFEIDENNMPYWEIEGKSYWIPSLYSFNYGNVHFMCVNSEIKNITETDAVKGYGFSKSGQIYPHIKEWCEKDIELYGASTDWNIAYCHEMPFHILTSGATKDLTMETAETAVRSEVGNVSVNTNISADEQYWFSEFCQTHNIRLVLGGHKHTQSTSYPLLENVKYTESDGSYTRSVKSMKPIIVVDSNTIKNFDNATSLVTVGEYAYPNTWVVNDTVSASYTDKAKLCTFMMDTDLSDSLYAEADGTVSSGNTTKPVVYAMSQATSYKTVSNKELPTANIPWIRYYHPANVVSGKDKANDTQLFPFYTIWEVKSGEIIGNVRKVYGIFNNDGGFSVNSEYPHSKKGLVSTTTADGLGILDESLPNYSEAIRSVNGLEDYNATKAGLLDNTKVINIVK